jgi:hypothetical protein
LSIQSGVTINLDCTQQIQGNEESMTCQHGFEELGRETPHRRNCCHPDTQFFKPTDSRRSDDLSAKLGFVEIESIEVKKSIFYCAWQIQRDERRP